MRNANATCALAAALAALACEPSSGSTAGGTDAGTHADVGTRTDAGRRTDASSVRDARAPSKGGAADSGRAADDGSAASDGTALTTDGADGATHDALATGNTDYGLLPNGKRDKTLWPFAVTSIWNMPIGSSAAYMPAAITSNNGDGYPTFFQPDEDIVVMTPSAPSTDVYYSGIAWNGGDRCPAQGNLLVSVPVPASYILPNSGQNNSAGFLAADETSVIQNQPFTRCTASASATTFATFPNEDIHGAGIGGAHGGSGLSALGGTIRLGELAFGKIQHALKIELWAVQYYSCCSPHWPATNVDGYASSTTYGGTNPHLGPGALLALLPSFDLGPLRTTPAKIIAQALQNYGAYVVDDVYSNGWGLCTEQGPNGSVVDEAMRLFSVNLHPASTDLFMSDLVVIFFR